MKATATLCAKHGTPLREGMDIFGGTIHRTCEACSIYRQADAREAMAKRDRDPDRAKTHMEIAERMKAKAALLEGRWFEVKCGGEVWDMSERQIEDARKRGITIEVLTEIV